MYFGNRLEQREVHVINRASWLSERPRSAKKYIHVSFAYMLKFRELKCCISLFNLISISALLSYNLTCLSQASWNLPGACPPLFRLSLVRLSVGWFFLNSLVASGKRTVICPLNYLWILLFSNQQINTKSSCSIHQHYCKTFLHLPSLHSR